jgi:hypothetical protein
MVIYAWLKIKLFVFVFRKQTTFWHQFGKRTQCGIVLWEMLTELFVRSFFQQNKLLVYFFSLLWHKIIVLISNMFIYAKIGNSKFVEMHGTLPDIYQSALVFYTRHRVNIMIYRTVYLHPDMCKHTVALLHCCNLNWGLANDNYSLYFSFWLAVKIYVCAIFSFRSYI